MKLKVPSVHSVLLLLVMITCLSTWIIPSGKYDRELNEGLGKEIPVAGTYQETNQPALGLVDTLMAPIQGFYNQDNVVQSLDIIFFVLILGGFIGVVNSTRALEAGITSLAQKLKGREHLMIPIVATFSTVGATTIGTAEEMLPMYLLFIPMALALGYDTIVGVAVILLGISAGYIGSVINPFSVIIASNAAGVPFTNGILFRTILTIIAWLICIIYLMWYAKRVKNDPSKSIIFHKLNEHKEYFCKTGDHSEAATLGKTQIKALVVMAVTFGIMIWGSASRGWWMQELTTVFIFGSIALAFICKIKEDQFIDKFMAGCGELLSVAIVIGMARAIVVAMENGGILDTILSWAESAASTMPYYLFGVMVIPPFLTGVRSRAMRPWPAAVWG
ncbi:YfcC family protein [Laribacter hongkongensis]|uniref:YfcC family protein n=1 Tax=Laribacter hongkongensis TaxID=168471 RepID=UPI001EFC96CA|nr:hypothetical protein [Laribacter hongkongensis]MCG9099156.1 hypothetical protein [Laribacter hongkongensis]